MRNLKTLLVIATMFITTLTAFGQNPFSATVLTSKNSTSAYATSQNAFYYNNCGTGTQDLRGQCTWYVEGRVQELAAAGKITASSANTVHNAMCPAGMSRNAKNWDDIIGGTWYSTASQALPMNLRNPGMLIIWEFGTYGHVAFVEEVSADKSQYRISEYNVATSLGYTSSVWLPFQGNDTRGWGVYPKFYPLQTAIQPAAQPTLLMPAANASNLIGNINFTWSCPNATEYRVQIIETSKATTFSTANGFSGTLAYNSNIGNIQSFLWTGAQAGKSYYWSVRANNASGTSGFAPYRTFSTSVATTGGGTAGCNFPTTLYYSNLTKNSATWWWSAVSNAVSYTVQYRLSNSSTFYNLGTYSAPYTGVNVTGLSPSTCYIYRVITNCSSGSSSASNTNTFCTPSTLSKNDNGTQSTVSQASERSTEGNIAEAELPIIGIRDIKITPNPSNGYFNVNYSASEGETTGEITIFDLTGRTILSKNIELNVGENDVKVSIDNVVKGVYFLKFSTNKSISSSNLIIE